jgi:proteasome lid subunit RPN8/RPN11
VLEVSKDLLERISRDGEQAYPEEGAGLLLGQVEGERRRVVELLAFPNAREAGARRNRYLITARDMLRGEDTAARLGLDVIGVYHSHPDHPDVPSEFDRDWALPWFSYLITRVDAGQVQGSRSWRLSDDRSAFYEEELVALENEP